MEEKIQKILEEYLNEIKEVEHGDLEEFRIWETSKRYASKLAKIMEEKN